MAEDGLTSVAAHVQWCREERDRLREEWIAHRDGVRIVGEPQFGAVGPSQGTITHMMYLQKNIEDLSCVIEAFALSADDQPPV